MGLMTSMSVGVTGLRSAQIGVNTTAQNLANLNTEGYSRQEVLNVDKIYNKIGDTYINYSQIGLGTEVAAIKQNRNVFFDKAYRLEVGRQNFYEVQSEAVSEVESLLGEMEGVQFQETLSDVRYSIEELVKEPDSIVKRTALIETCNTFLIRSQDVYNQLKEYQVNLNTQISDAVDRINDIGQEIWSLNKAIVRAEVSGQEHANDYRDQRNLLLDELAEYVSITYSEDIDGRVLVNVEGTQFVSQDFVYPMSTTYIREDSTMLNVVWGQTDHRVFNLDHGFSSAQDTDVGKLKGLLIARGDNYMNYTAIPESDCENQTLVEYNRSTGCSVIANTEAEFDKLVHAVVTSINDALNPNDTADVVLNNLGLTSVSDTVTYVNASGEEVEVALDKVKIWDEYHAAVGMDANKTPREEMFSRQSVERYTEATIEVTGEDGNVEKKTIYIYNEEDPADTYTLYTIDQLVLNERIQSNPSMLPISANNYLGGADGYDVATCDRLTGIWEEEFGTLNPNTSTTYTFGDFYQAMLGELATVGNEYSSMASNQEALADSIDDNRQTVSGVSSDEQLTYLIQFQYAYTASSRYITTVDEMLEHLLNALG